MRSLGKLGTAEWQCFVQIASIITHCLVNWCHHQIECSTSCMFLMKVIRINRDNVAIRTKQGGLPNSFRFSTRISNPNPYKTSGRFIKQSIFWKPRSPALSSFQAPRYAFGFRSQVSTSWP